MSDFTLSEKFLLPYKTKEPDWGPLGEFVYLRTYSRFMESENRNEIWWETVKRAVEGTFNIQKQHCDNFRLPWKPIKAQKSAQIMYDKIFNFKFLPPGRGLWSMGSNFIKDKGSMSLNNCAMISTEDIQTRGSFAFTWTMDALMLGVGVGFDTKGANKINIKTPKPRNGLTYQIPDSREGWVESVGMTIDAFFDGKQLPIFDYSLIRPYGEPIKGFGGVASGPAPLKELHKNLEKLLEIRIDSQLSSTDIVDIMNMIGVCVVAGNVRRSAEIALGDVNDEEYITMKNFNLHPEELQSHRWSSNNSVFVEVGKTKYENIVNSIALNGEPGLVWLDNIRGFGRMNDSKDYKDRFAVGVNPCSEMGLESGELCNLVETFPSRHDSFDEFKETLKYAYLYAKTVTLLPTHVPETNAVMMKNRRIGTSMTGIIDAFVKHGRAEVFKWSDNGYNYLRQLDEIYSNWLCIPKSIKISTVKPSGSVSLLPGVSPGIHYPHSEYYIRRVRADRNLDIVKAFQLAGYPVEDSVYGTEESKKNTVVLSFPVHEENFSKKKDDVSIWEQVKNSVDMQRYWSDNSVSITVTFKKEEAKEIANVLYAFEDQLKSISFLPLQDHGYEQAPYEEITKEKYENMISKITKVDLAKVRSETEAEKFCTNDSCLI